MDKMDLLMMIVCAFALFALVESVPYHREVHVGDAELRDSSAIATTLENEHNTTLPQRKDCFGVLRDECLGRFIQSSSSVRPSTCGTKVFYDCLTSTLNSTDECKSDNVAVSIIGEFLHHFNTLFLLPGKCPSDFERDEIIDLFRNHEDSFLLEDDHEGEDGHYEEDLKVDGDYLELEPLDMANEDKMEDHGDDDDDGHEQDDHDHELDHEDDHPIEEDPIDGGSHKDFEMALISGTGRPVIEESGTPVVEDGVSFIGNGKAFVSPGWHRTGNNKDIHEELHLSGIQSGMHVSGSEVNDGRATKDKHHIKEHDLDSVDSELVKIPTAEDQLKTPHQLNVEDVHHPLSGVDDFIPEGLEEFARNPWIPHGKPTDAKKQMEDIKRR